MLHQTFASFRRRLLPSVFLLLPAVAFSQGEKIEERKFAFSAGVRAAWPQRSLLRSYKFGGGIELQGELQFAPYLSGVASAAMLHFPTKSPNTYSRGRTNVYLMAGLHIYPVPVFFLGGKAGLTPGSYPTLTYEPIAGINLRRFQVAAAYNVIFETDYRYDHFGLSLRYKFF